MQQASGVGVGARRAAWRSSGAENYLENGRKGKVTRLCTFYLRKSEKLPIP
jgi:hypothetical protein